MHVPSIEPQPTDALYLAVREEPFGSAVVTMRATEDGRCARRRTHRITVGSLVGIVPGFGVCCELCCT